MNWDKQSNAYTAEELVIIQRMALDKASAAQIALAIPRHSRNSIIGFCRRRAIKLQYHAIRRERRARNAAEPRGLNGSFVSKALPVAKIPVKASIVRGRPESCRWIAAEPKDFGWCQNAPHKHRPFCLEHSRIAYHGFVE